VVGRAPGPRRRRWVGRARGGWTDRRRHSDLSLLQRHQGAMGTEATASRRIVKEPRSAGRTRPQNTQWSA
jgi:hypothetical protein